MATVETVGVKTLHRPALGGLDSSALAPLAPHVLTSTTIIESPLQRWLAANHHPDSNEGYAFGLEDVYEAATGEKGRFSKAWEKKVQVAIRGLRIPTDPKDPELEWEEVAQVIFATGLDQHSPLRREKIVKAVSTPENPPVEVSPADLTPAEAYLKRVVKPWYWAVDVWRAMGFATTPPVFVIPDIRTIANRHYDPSVRHGRISPQVFPQVVEEADCEISLAPESDEMELFAWALAARTTPRLMIEASGSTIAADQLDKLREAAQTFSLETENWRALQGKVNRTAFRLELYKQNQQPIQTRAGTNANLQLVLACLPLDRIKDPRQLFMDIFLKAKQDVEDGNEEKLDDQSFILTDDEQYVLGITMLAQIRKNIQVIEKYGVRIRTYQIDKINEVTTQLKEERKLRSGLPDLRTVVVPSLVQKMLNFAKGENRVLFFNNNSENAMALLGTINGLNEEQLTSLIKELYGPYLPEATPVPPNP